MPTSSFKFLFTASPTATLLAFPKANLYRGNLSLKTLWAV